MDNNIGRPVYVNDLKPGDVILVLMKPLMIHHFEKYNGKLDFVEKIAVFTTGQRMSLEKDRYYNLYVPGWV